MKYSLIRSTFTVASSFIVVITVVSAWTAPQISAPDGNVSAPINVNNQTQTKTGGDINLGGGGSLLAGGIVGAPTLCIGLDCRTEWPAAVGGAIAGSVLSIMNTSTLTSPNLVKVDFTSESNDVYGAFDPLTDEIKLPTGTYLFEFSSIGCGFNANDGTGSDQFDVRLVKNGSIVLKSETFVSQTRVQLS